MNPLSHPQLRRWYTSYNRRWFDGKLPAEMDVLYVPMDDTYGLAVCHESGQRIIQIDTGIAGTRHARIALLHEMNHHATGAWNHGEKFENGMKRLALLGAFKGIW